MSRIAPVNITLLAKPGCHLCDEARTVISRVRASLAQRGFATVFDEQNILDDPKLARLHAEEIPVVLLNGRRHAFWHVDEQRLAAAVTALSTDAARRDGAPKRAVLGGGSGLLGRALHVALEAAGWRVQTIARQRADASWNDPSAVRELVDGAQLLVGLAGKSVNCRYIDANRDEIFRSRVDTTRALHEAVSRASQPPPVWMNASTATIYRYALDRPQTEGDTEYGTGFSPDVARAWEAEFFRGELPHTRRIALRTTIVLGSEAPVTAMLFRLASLGLGGTQYDGWWFAHHRYRGIGADPSEHPGWVRSRGKQKFSWVHIDDVVGAVQFLLDHPEISGAVNLAAPQQSDNRSLMAVLREVVGMPVGLPAPRCLLEPAMWALRTESELVLKSRWVAPKVLVDAGYEFRYPELLPALRAIRAAVR